MGEVFDFKVKPCPRVYTFQFFIGFLFTCLSDVNVHQVSVESIAQKPMQIAAL